MSEARQLDLDTIRQGSEGYADRDELLMDAIDLASDQGQRSWVMSGGKRIAMIIPVDDGELLEQVHQLCHCGPHDWRDDCPLHGAERIGH